MIRLVLVGELLVDILVHERRLAHPAMQGAVRGATQGRLLDHHVGIYILNRESYKQ